MDEANVCRSCLISAEKDLRNIYSTSMNQNKISDILMECTAIEFSSSDGLPKYICRICTNILSIVEKFRAMCILSDSILRNYTQVSEKYNVKEYLAKSRLNEFQIYYEQFNVLRDINVNVEVIESISDITNEEKEIEIVTKLCKGKSHDINLFPVIKSTTVLKEEESKNEFVTEINTRESSGKNNRAIAESTDALKQEKNENEFGIVLCKGDSPNINHSDDWSNDFYEVSNEKDYSDHLKKISSDTENKVVSLEKGEPQDPQNREMSKKEIEKKLNIINLKRKTIRLNKLSLKERQKQKKELRVCYICGKLTLSLTDHLITHRAARDWKCGKCGKLFSSRVAVRKHQAVHNPAKVHVCEICGTSFSTKHTLVRHIRTVHYPTKAFECSICSKRFENAYNLKVHKMRHSGESQYKCKQCPEQFTCKIKFREHNMYKHNLKPKKLFKCEKCNLAFVYNFQLIAHKKKPEHEAGGRFICDYCGDQFEKQKIYLKHMKLKHSTDLEPRNDCTEEYKCDICNKIFKQKKCLKQHEKLHEENGKKFKCQLCGKAFLYNAFLKEHTRVHTGERPAKCELCNNAYISFRQLKKHIKTHKLN